MDLFLHHGGAGNPLRMHQKERQAAGALGEGREGQETGGRVGARDRGQGRGRRGPVGAGPASRPEDGEEGCEQTRMLVMTMVVVGIGGEGKSDERAGGC